MPPRTPASSVGRASDPEIRGTGFETHTGHLVAESDHTSPGLFERPDFGLTRPWIGQYTEVMPRFGLSRPWVGQFKVIWKIPNSRDKKLVRVHGFVRVLKKQKDATIVRKKKH